jgi:hypothetical protein
MTTKAPRCSSAGPMHPNIDDQALIQIASFYGFGIDAEIAGRVAGPVQSLLTQCNALWEENLEHVPMSLMLPDPHKD